MSQDTPTKGGSTSTGSTDSFGTPLSRNGISVSSGEFCTPPQITPVRNRALDKLKGSQDAKSPMLQIPESPVMQRLGYGTGVGVYLLERSPRLCGDLRSPWAIKKTVKVCDDSHEIFAGRIEYEAEILKQLAHPNIIGFRGFGNPSPGTTYLAMEKASQSLADLIEDRVEEVMLFDDCDAAAPFPSDKIEKVAVEVGKALAYLHDEVRMVHGDLKSANVLIFGDFEKIKLCDFGVARKLAKDGTVDGSYIGTEIWCSMEVIKAKRREQHVPITHKADIFPFGLTIHEMITLKPPHLSSAEDSLLETQSTSASEPNTESSETSGDNGTDNVSDSFDELAYEEALARYVGTRPPLPDIEFDPSYTTILGIYYCCTEEDPNKRPDAKDIVSALAPAENIS